MNGSLDAVYSDRDLFTGNHERPFESALALPVVQERHVIVVAKHEEIVVVMPIPACHLGGLGIPVGLGSVRMDVTLLPLVYHWALGMTLSFLLETVRTVFIMATDVNRHR